MRAGMISSSQLFASGRWDAGFNLTLKELTEDGSIDRARVVLDDMIAQDHPGHTFDDKTMVKCRQDKAWELLSALPGDLRKSATEDLVRGQDSRRIEEAVREYPEMAVALAFRNNQAESRLKETIESAKTQLDKISGIGAALRSPKP